MRLLETIRLDVRHTVRMMKWNIGLTLISILSLALGMGATIAIFSVIYALTLRSLPVQHPEQLVEITRADGGNLHSYSEWNLFRDRQDIFNGVLAYNYFDTSFRVGQSGAQREISGVYVSGGYFSTLGVSAVLGRVLQPSDDGAGAFPVCVLGYGLWQRVFGHSRDVLGRAIQINGNEFVVVGVVPRTFYGVDIGGMPEIFMPLETERTYKDYPLLYGRQTPSLDEGATLLSFVARLKPGMTLATTNARLQVLTAAIDAVLVSRFNAGDKPFGVHQYLLARPIPNGTPDTWMQTMDIVLLLMSMATIGLIIACANLGNLLLARAAKRRAEIATRLALGATRFRLLCQCLTESLTLSAIGAVTGLVVARWGSQMLLWSLSFPDSRISLDLSWDAKLGAFALIITLACALLFGMAPALSATDLSPYAAMRGGAIGGKPRQRITNCVLIAGQVALSITVLVSAAMLTRTLQMLLAVDPGYDPKGVIVAHASWQGSRDGPQREAMFGNELLKAFRFLPGITSASWSRTLAKPGLSKLVVVDANGAEKKIGSYLVFASSDFFRTWRTPLLAGREFDDGDTDVSAPVAVLSATLARMLFGRANAVGQRLREVDTDRQGHDYMIEIIGVAKDIQFRRPSDAPLPILYRPVSQCHDLCTLGDYQIRAKGSLETAKLLEDTATTVNPHIFLKCEPLRNMQENSVHRNRAMADLALAFALFVCFLAIIGVYGLTAHAVAERTREIAIRMSLGASPADVMRLLYSEVMRLVGIGVAVGLIALVPMIQLIRGAIWGLKLIDSPSLVFAVTSMLAIAGIATFVPARRAMRVDPVSALKFE